MNNTCHFKILDSIEIYRKVQFLDHFIQLEKENKRITLDYDFEYV